MTVSTKEMQNQNLKIWKLEMDVASLVRSFINTADESVHGGAIVQSNLQLYTHVTSQLSAKGAIHCKITA